MPSSSISNDNTVSPAQAYYGDSVDVESLTGDALLMYCQTRLGDLDNEINLRMGDQKAALARRQAIQSAEVELKKYGDKGPQNQEQWDACENALRAAEAQLPPGDPGIAAIEQFRVDIVHQYCK